MTKTDPANEPGTDDLSSEQRLTALFGAMVLQQTNIAMMFLGQVPNPETGKRAVDLGAAQMFIDQLEMIECKTKGNLTPEEAALLGQSLMSVRMAYVDCAKGGAKPAPATPSTGATAAKEPTPSTAVETSAGDSEESRKRFTKKY